jgi:hypothetical protein
MKTLPLRFRVVGPRIVRWFDELIDRFRVHLLHAALWLVDRLRGEVELTDSDMEVLTPRSLRRLEIAHPELAFPRRPLAEATVRRGWVHVGQTTILGLGAPARPRTNSRAPQEALEPSWRDDARDQRP